jgi:hypothetical protein
MHNFIFLSAFIVCQPSAHKNNELVLLYQLKKEIAETAVLPYLMVVFLLLRMTRGTRLHGRDTVDIDKRLSTCITYVMKRMRWYIANLAITYCKCGLFFAD